jgi:hypothetical protein
MNNKKLEAIANKAADDLKALIKESEDKIIEAWDAVTDDAQENETAPKFKLGLAITLDLDADKMESALTFSIRRKLTVECTIPDPNQPPLPMDDGGTVTLESGGKSVTLGTKQFSEGLKRLNKAATGSKT